MLVICPDEADDQPGGTHHRRLFLNPIKDQFPDRFFVFERLGTPPLRLPTGPRAYVHSKLLLVDDEAAFIGSVNCNQRGYFHDTEVLATLVDANGPGGAAPGSRGVARQLRCDLWAEHLGVPSAGMGDHSAGLALWQNLAGGPSIHVRPFSHASPGRTNPLTELLFNSAVDPV